MKGNAFRDAFGPPTLDTKAARFVTAFAKLIANHDAQAIEAGLALWQAEVDAEDSDRTEEEAAAAELVARAIRAAKERAIERAA